MKEKNDVLSSLVEQYFQENLIGKFGEEQEELVKSCLRDFPAHYLGWKPESDFWEGIPPEFKFAAMDKDTNWFIYTHKPTPDKGMWAGSDRIYDYDKSSGQYVSKTDNTNRYMLLIRSDFNWGNTLQERPSTTDQSF